MPQTKGQLEAEISDAIIRFEKEYMGRGPLETKTYIIDDLVIVRLKGVLTRAECQLAESNEASVGRELIKRMRHALLEKGRPMLDAIVKDVVGIPVKSLHTDLSTVTGERLIVFSLEAVPELPSNTRDDKCS
ncbi:DUF2294 domain-containing protein [Desulfuromonas sp. AOP6]|uniref:DUF2294 domain-containing protein n=1 Tax=Desulfuromonas sp. AOP6 TaxID=1566351 RepID=UPI00126B0A5B|nr:DUF2294 domain-containing protein [Desulfuromonas sp. AOP6]BCA78805.1 hypothetical protein AOP6_0592 [Desulfuromonas sp. AOP6]